MHNNLSQISVQQMLIFIEVAEKKSFTKAAESLNLTQTAVSKSVSRLSQKLECPLVTGTTREWNLTSEGERLYHNWKEHLGPIQTCYNRIWEERHTVPQLKVGVSNFVQLSSVFDSASERFLAKNPQTELLLESEAVANILENLISYHYDLILTPGFMTEYLSVNHMLEWKWIAKSELYVLIPNSDPLSRKISVTIEDICGSAFANPQYSYFTSVLSHYGSILSGSRLLMKPETFRMNYAHLKHLMFVDRFFDQAAFRNSSAVRVVPSEQFSGIDAGIIAVWRKDNVSISLDEFVKVLRRVGMSRE